MSILLETTFGDIVIDLDIDGSPALCKNILKLVKARYYTNTLVYNIVPGKYSQMGDPKGDGTGGCSIYGLIDSYQSTSSSTTNNKQPPDVTQSKRRFLQSHGRTLSTNELNQKGLLIAMEIGNVPHTIGSQFLLTLSDNNGLQDLISTQDNNLTIGDDKQQANNNNSQTRYLSLGKVTEDTQNVLNKLNRAYCDDDGRPYADIRIIRALVVHDPYDDPEGMSELLKLRGVTTTTGGDTDEDDATKDGYALAPSSPTYERPPEETVPVRIQADDTTLFATAGWDDNNNENDSEEEDEETKQKRLELQAKQEEEWKQRQDTSRAVMLEMLGDRPSAEVEAPENVLFVCKLNPFTNDEDLELIFSRFDQEAKAEIIRDPDTGASLQYAFVEFKSNEAANEAYLKMNNALVDDRRIRVDFSQSVSNVWDRFNKKYRRGDKSAGVDRGFMDNSGRGRGSGGGRGRGNRGRGRGPGRGHHLGGHHLGPRDQSSAYRPNSYHQQQNQSSSRYNDRDRKESGFDNFDRRVQDTIPTHHSKSHDNEERQNPHLRRSPSRSRSRDDNSREDRRRRKHSRSRSDSSDYSRQRKSKKHHKHRRKDSSRHRKRSRSHDRERKHKHKKHRRRRRDEDDERRRDRKHHRHDDCRSRSR